jgi:tetratricopeptide (TPR) repeat protein
MARMGSHRAIGLLLLLAPALAAAQPQPTPAAKQAASERVKKAIAKSQAGEHETAIDLYLEAYAIIPQPLLLSNVGSEYQQLKKPVEALKYFCKYLEADPTGANVTYAASQARILYVELGGVPTVPYEDVCKPIVKAPPPADPPPKPQPASSPALAPDPAPAPGPVDSGPTTSTPAIRYVGIGFAIVGAAAFGAGTYYGLEARRISDEITNHDVNDPWPGNIKDLEAEGKAAEQKQIALMIGGGVALAAGVVMFIVGAPETTNEATVSFTPIATPDTLGFAAGGRF